MRFSKIDRHVPGRNAGAAEDPYGGATYGYLPSIYCSDCDGSLVVPTRDAAVAALDRHLESEEHKMNVETRRNRLDAETDIYTDAESDSQDSASAVGTPSSPVAMEPAVKLEIEGFAKRREAGRLWRDDIEPETASMKTEGVTSLVMERLPRSSLPLEKLAWVTADPSRTWSEDRMARSVAKPKPTGPPPPTPKWLEEIVKMLRSEYPSGVFCSYMCWTSRHHIGTGTNVDASNDPVGGATYEFLPAVYCFSCGAKRLMPSLAVAYALVRGHFGTEQHQCSAAAVSDKQDLLKKLQKFEDAKRGLHASTTSTLPVKRPSTLASGSVKCERCDVYFWPATSHLHRKSCQYHPGSS